MTNVMYSLHQNNLRTRQYSLLTNNLLGIVMPNSNYSLSSNKTETNLINFETNVNVNMTLENGLKV